MDCKSAHLTVEALLGKALFCSDLTGGLNLGFTLKF